jgi:hypothetical protein
LVRGRLFYCFNLKINRIAWRECFLKEILWIRIDQGIWW